VEKNAFKKTRRKRQGSGFLKDFLQWKRWVKGQESCSVVHSYFGASTELPPMQKGGKKTALRLHQVTQGVPGNRHEAWHPKLALRGKSW